MKQDYVYCKSEIDSECYVCPVCRKWIHPFRLKKNNPIMKMIIGFTLLYVVIFRGATREVCWLEPEFTFKLQFRDSRF